MSEGSNAGTPRGPDAIAGKTVGGGRCAYYCPDCEWFAIGVITGYIAECPECETVLRARILTAHELGMTDSWREDVEDDRRRYKGRTNENECRRILSRVYSAAKVAEHGVHDPFGLVDVMAIEPGRKPKFVQVKTNRFADRSKYRREAERRIPVEYIDFEVWVRVDREGWKIYEWDGEEFDLVFESESCDEDKIVRKWRAHETGTVETSDLQPELIDYVG